MLDLFVFQADDGIRDYKVTGVQTCALPISRSRPRPTRRGRPSPGGPQPSSPRKKTSRRWLVVAKARCRSEERRVGKEGRDGWASQEIRKNEAGTKPAKRNPECRKKSNLRCT